MKKWVKFNNSSEYYFLNNTFTTNKTFLSEGELPQDKTVLTSGFKTFDPLDKTKQWEDFSDYTLIWENANGFLVLSNDKTVYKTYFIINSEGFATSQTVSSETLEGEQYALYRSGIGREYFEPENIEFYDEDGFFKYKVENGEIVNTTTEDKEEWMKQYTYNIIFCANDEGFVDRYEIKTVKEEIDDPEKKVIYRTEVSLDGYPDTNNIQIFDENGIPTSKIVNGEIVGVSAEDIDYLTEKKRQEEEEQETNRIKDSKSRKIEELRAECGRQIVAGVNMGEEHFSYDTSDQANIANLINLVKQVKMDLPYHADNKSCRLFTPAELTQLYVLQESNVTHHTTYFNQLRRMIENMEKPDENWENIQYGDSLTGEYLDTYNEMMTAARAVVDAFLGEAA